MIALYGPADVNQTSKFSVNGSVVFNLLYVYQVFPKEFWEFYEKLLEFMKI